MPDFYPQNPNPYYNVDRDSIRALIHAISYVPSAEEYAALERELVARQEAKAAKKAEKQYNKDLKKDMKRSQKAYLHSSNMDDDAASLFSFRSFGSRVPFLPRKSHPQAKR